MLACTRTMYFDSWPKSRPGPSVCAMPASADSGRVEIDAEEEIYALGARFDLAMAGLLVLLGCSLLLYLSHAVVVAR